MIEITIPGSEFFDDEKEEFINIEPRKFRLEHSLVALSKWESHWHKPFLGNHDKAYEEMIDYIRCMTLDKVDDPGIYKFIPQDEIDRVAKYIEDSMTATWFTEKTTEPSNTSEAVTAEIIYYWMLLLRIPIEMENWHLNRLLTLIKVINVKQQPKKKMDKKEAAKWRAKENARRRALYKSKG